MATNEGDWKIIIEEHGRSGVIRYLEDGNEIRFDWEFSGGNSVVFIWGPKELNWDTKYPWAADRRQPIYERVAEGAIAQKAPSCKYKLDINSGTIDIYKS